MELSLKLFVHYDVNWRVPRKQAESEIIHCAHSSRQCITQGSYWFVTIICRNLPAWRDVTELGNLYTSLLFWPSWTKLLLFTTMTLNYNMQRSCAVYTTQSTVFLPFLISTSSNKTIGNYRVPMNIQIHVCIKETKIDKTQNAPTLFIVLMQDAIKIIEIKKTGLYIIYNSI